MGIKIILVETGTCTHDKRVKVGFHSVSKYEEFSIGHSSPMDLKDNFP